MKFWTFCFADYNRVVILHPRIGFYLCSTEKSEFYRVFFKFQILLWEV
nr:MAG TPA: hypothetical protein [Caudoviricetes sp.]